MIARVFTPLVLALSLAMGTVACMNAYLPTLESASAAVAAGRELVLGAPAGKITGDDGKDVPIAKAGEKLTPELVAKLRAGGVERVRVLQFAFSRWSHAWLFGLSAAGLLVGAFLVRSRKAVRAGSAGDSGLASPEAAMSGLREGLRSLESRLPELEAADDGMKRLADGIEELQSTHIDAILQSREQIIAAGGLAGFAAFMSAFSILERQVNRAWSAAADDEPGEACASVRRALALVDSTENSLPRG